ncbi:putative AP endonuclease, family 2 [Aspergillus avenaceus]|uniref:Putative AP endonuclease, family 2 n=1 Tax=Aspergillus avenaceus TaxID=36643 RepID=A0A5N6TY65_ASPAV|nr:putative AP endonuclease, family 2 [Aspergillus avenaceus]
MLQNKLAIAVLSLGQHQSHTLDHKIRVAAEAGYAGVEIVYSNLQAYSRVHNLSMLEGAEQIFNLCESLNLEIISLAPFENFEGGHAPLSQRLQTGEHWIEIARQLRAPYLQVPANYNPDAIGTKEVVVSELQQLADIGSAKQPVVSIAFEFMSWSTHCSTWESALHYVKAVNRSNFGLCLDTFHIGTKIWGDNSVPGGKFSDANKALSESLRRFTRECPLDKIFFVQLSDAERFDPPFSKDHPWYVEGEAPEFTWSKHARPFPFEHSLGAYLPITEMVKAWVVDTGYTGWVSLEIFDRRMRDKDHRPEIAAARGMESWKTLQKRLEGASKI